MKAITVRQPLATLAGLGVVTVLVLPDPAPEGLVGQRVGIYANETEPESCCMGEWHARRSGPDAWYVYNSDGSIHPLPLGAVVASATLQAVLPVEDIDMPYDEIQTLDQGVVVYMCSSSPGYLMHVNRFAAPTIDVDLSDQLPYLPDSIRPGMWAYILSDPARCEDTCPSCFMRYPDEFDMDHDRRCPGGGPECSRLCPVPVCSTCKGSGSCEPIRVAGGPGPIFEWSPA